MPFFSVNSNLKVNEKIFQLVEKKRNGLKSLHEEYPCRVRGQEVKGQGRISSVPFAHFFPMLLCTFLPRMPTLHTCVALDPRKTSIDFEVQFGVWTLNILMVSRQYLHYIMTYNDTLHNVSHDFRRILLILVQKVNVKPLSQWNTLTISVMNFGISKYMYMCVHYLLVLHNHSHNMRWIRWENRNFDCIFFKHILLHNVSTQNIKEKLETFKYKSKWKETSCD